MQNQELAERNEELQARIRKTERELRVKEQQASAAQVCVRECRQHQFDASIAFKCAVTCASSDAVEVGQLGQIYRNAVAPACHLHAKRSTFVR